MAVECNAVSERLQRTTGIVSSSSDYTAVFWFKNNNTPGVGKYKTAWVVREAVYNDYIGIFSVPNTNNYRLEADNGGGPTLGTTVALSTGQWYVMFYTRSGT